MGRRLALYILGEFPTHALVVFVNDHQFRWMGKCLAYEGCLLQTADRFSAVMISACLPTERRP